MKKIIIALILLFPAVAFADPIPLPWYNPPSLWGQRLYAYNDAIGATTDNGVLISNRTAALVGTPAQNSPALVFSGTSWTGAASSTQLWYLYLAASASGTAGSTLTLDYKNGAGSQTNAWAWDATGNFLPKDKAETFGDPTHRVKRIFVGGTVSTTGDWVLSAGWGSTRSRARSSVATPPGR